MHISARLLHLYVYISAHLVVNEYTCDYVVANVCGRNHKRIVWTEQEVAPPPPPLRVHK